ncbi:MAG: BrnT family toxin [Gammaproteobacteria bacterium]|nr:BrnT family toxin [Pseudomonadales bacterium]MCP5346301.1 BrnT family toxin [Pseudomonadales bacterium]
MFDWRQVSGFDWDGGNFRKSDIKHGVSNVEAEQIFFNRPLLIVTDTKQSQKEPRCHALGKTDSDRLLHISFTLRAKGTLIRIISARDMHRKERVCYDKA